MNALLAAALSLAASARSCSESSFGSERLSVESVGEGALDGGVERTESAGDDGVDEDASVLIVVRKQVSKHRWEAFHLEHCGRDHVCFYHLRASRNVHPSDKITNFFAGA